jgi:hypothetical protein
MTSRLLPRILDAVLATGTAYEVTDFRTVDDANVFVLTLTDPVTGTNVPMVWTLRDEKESAEKPDAFATTMAENALYSMGQLLELPAEKRERYL